MNGPERRSARQIERWRGGTGRPVAAGAGTDIQGWPGLLPPSRPELNVAAAIGSAAWVVAIDAASRTAGAGAGAAAAAAVGAVAAANSAAIGPPVVTTAGRAAPADLAVVSVDRTAGWAAVATAVVVAVGEVARG